jgi:ABC-2 type transport system permease protein
VSTVDAGSRRGRALPGLSAPEAALKVVAIARHAVWVRRRATLTWGVPLGALCVLIVAIFPSIHKAVNLNHLIAKYPDAIRETFVGHSNLNTVQGYLHAEVFSLIAPLAVGFFGIRVLATAICGAEEQGTLDLALSNPISRKQFLGGWFAGMALGVVPVLTVIASMTWLGSLIFGAHLSLGDAVAGALNLWPIAVFFGGIAAVFAGALHRSAHVVGASLSVLVAMYFVDVLGRLSGVLEPLRPLSVFSHYGSAIEHGIDFADFTLVALAGVVLAVVGALLFERRDIYA